MKTENEPQLFEHYLCRVDACWCISENCLTTGQESKQPLFCWVVYNNTFTLKNVNGPQLGHGVFSSCDNEKCSDYHYSLLLLWYR